MEQVKAMRHNPRSNSSMVIKQGSSVVEMLDIGQHVVSRTILEDQILSWRTNHAIPAIKRLHKKINSVPRFIRL